MRGARGLRELLRGSGIIVAPGAYDAVSARLVEQAGFDAVYYSLLLYAAHRAVREVLAAFRAHGDRSALESRLTSEAEFDEFIGFPRIQALAARHGMQ